MKNCLELAEVGIWQNKGPLTYYGFFSYSEW